MPRRNRRPELRSRGGGKGAFRRHRAKWDVPPKDPAEFWAWVQERLEKIALREAFQNRPPVQTHERPGAWSGKEPTYWPIRKGSTRQDLLAALRQRQDIIIQIVECEPAVQVARSARGLGFTVADQERLVDVLLIDEAIRGEFRKRVAGAVALGIKQDEAERMAVVWLLFRCRGH